LLLVSATDAPPVGAAELSVTVKVAVPPLVVVVGLIASALTEIEPAGSTVTVAVWLDPL
jgi:hypothetical protein